VRPSTRLSPLSSALTATRGIGSTDVGTAAAPEPMPFEFERGWGAVGRGERSRSEYAMLGFVTSLAIARATTPLVDGPEKQFLSIRSKASENGKITGAG